MKRDLVLTGPITTENFGIISDIGSNECSNSCRFEKIQYGAFCVGAASSRDKPGIG
jgi:hypothetical protein